MTATRTITGGRCAYCLTARAVHTDHIVSGADRRRYRIAKNDARFHVPACGPCNWRKLTSRLLPASHEHLIPELNALMTGVRWRVWDGGKIPEAVR